jgi:hypothetical protein
MLTHLKQLYEPSTDTEFFMLMRELFDTKFDSFPSTEAYLTHIRTVNDKISRTKVELSAEKRALLCLTMTLPHHFETLVQMWSLKTPTFDDCCTAITDYQRRSDDKYANQITEANSYVTLKSKSHCNKCPNAKKPHRPEDCWKAHPEKRPDWAKKNDSTGITAAMAATQISQITPPASPSYFHF